MKAKINYRIEKVPPSVSGLERAVYDVIGSFTKDGRQWTMGIISYRGCETFREAKTMQRVLQGEHPNIEI